MTVEPDPIFGAEADHVVDSEPMQVVAGRMISFRFLVAAVKRRRRFWMGLALLGLIVGVGYHLVVPVKYSATTTLYLAAPPGTNETVASSNNLAMLDTAAVGQRAITLLGEHDLTPKQLLGKAPGTAVSDNVLTITISGPSSKEAVRRANAVAKAYLAFRTQEDNAQNQAVVTAANKEITKLQQRIDGLTAQINALETKGQSQQLSNLVSARSAATTQINALQQSIQTNNLESLSAANGSDVITSGTSVEVSKVKILGLDGVTGLGVGLVLGLMIVVIEAALSEKLRRREDIAAVLGAPVQISVGRARLRSRLRRTSVRAMASSPEPEVQTVTQYLQDRLVAKGPKPTEMVVAIDDVTVPALAMVSLACTLSAPGKRVLLVDATANRVLARAFGTTDRADSHQVCVGAAPAGTLLVPKKPWESVEHNLWEYDLAAAQADAVLILATVEPAVGAWHLRTWALDAVVTVTAGRSTGQHISAIAELLEAAGVSISAAVLLGADDDDDSVGLPEPAGVALFAREAHSRRVHEDMDRSAPTSMRISIGPEDGTPSGPSQYSHRPGVV